MEPTKECHACKKDIHPDASRCPYCQSDQPDTVGGAISAIIMIVAVCFALPFLFQACEAAGKLSSY